MTIKVGINGFGRIGRMVFRSAVQNFPGEPVTCLQHAGTCAGQAGLDGSQ